MKRLPFLPFPAAVLLLAAAVLAGGCASGAAPAAAAPADSDAAAATASTSPAATAQPEATEAAAAEPAAAPAGDGRPAVDTSIEPTGGVWLVDDRGREYTTRRYDKVEGSWRWFGEGKILVAGGLRFDVAEEAEDHFLVKVYRPQERPRRAAEDAALPMGGSTTQAEVLAQPAGLAQLDRLEFTSLSQGLPERGQWRNGFALVDFDGDGRLDIVHGPARKGQPVPWTFLNAGAEGWRARPLDRLPAGLRLDYGDVAVADFNRDGRLDLALGVHLRGVVVLVDDGTGGFAYWSEGIPYTRLTGPDAEGPGELTSRALETVDWNGDGWIDLVALGEGARMAVQRSDAEFRAGSTDVVVFLNQGDGTWQAESVSGLRRLRGDSLGVADLDGDGRPDLVTSWMNSAIPEPVVLNRTRTEDGRTVVEGEPVRLPGLDENTLVPAIAIADFDGDGRDDLALSYYASSGQGRRHGIAIYLARPEGWLRRDALGLDGRRRIGAMAAGRLPGDDHVDLVAFDDQGNGWVLLGDGTGAFQVEAAPGVGASERFCSGYAVLLADVDGEPGDEIVAAFSGEPGGEVMLGKPGQCVSQGQLAAWKATPK
jgi:hypothetical protein